MNLIKTAMKQSKSNETIAQLLDVSVGSVDGKVYCKEDKNNRKLEAHGYQCITFILSRTQPFI